MKQIGSPIAVMLFSMTSNLFIQMDRKLFNALQHEFESIQRVEIKALEKTGQLNTRGKGGTDEA